MEEAKTDFLKSTSLHHKHANAYYYLGKIAQKDGDTGDTNNNFEKALKINPKHVGANREIKKKTIIRLPIKNTHAKDNTDIGIMDQNDDEFLLPQNRYPFVSAYAGRICFWILGGLITLLAITNSKIGYNPVIRRELLLMSLMIFFFLLLFVLRIKKTVYNFYHNKMFTIESGLFGSSVKNYDLRYLIVAEPRQTLINRITRDGILVLKLRLPSQHGGSYMKELRLKGIAKWDELKSIGIYLNSLLQEKE